MKTEFLKSLGIVDEKVIEAIHAENGKDITHVRNQLDAMTQERDSLKNQIGERDEQLSELKKSTKDNEDLTKRLEALEAENKQSKETHAAELATLRKNNAVDMALTNDKVKNVKAVKPFLKLEDIRYENDTLVGYKEQIDKLRADEQTAFLFELAEPTPLPKPSGAEPGKPNPSAGGNPQATTFRDAIANALGAKNK